MDVGGATTVVVLGTFVWVAAIALQRVRHCHFWRTPHNNRRKERLPYAGPDRRRCKSCPYANRCTQTRGCNIEIRAIMDTTAQPK